MNTREDDVTRDMLDRIRAIRGKAAGTGWGIIKEEKESFFTLETKGMKFTFSINNLKQVLEAISND